VLADPTPELAERYEFTGNAFVLGPFVTTVDPSAGSLAAQFQEGDSIESVEITDDGDTYFGMSRTVESVKGSIASEIAAGRTTVRLGVYRRRNQDRVLLVQLSRMERWLYLP
jgi:hypothetical protein